MKTINFGEGKVLIRWNHRIDGDKAVLPCGVTFEVVDEPHAVGSYTGEPDQIISGDLPDRDVMLTFANTKSLDVLIEELVGLRLKFTEGGAA